VFELLPPAGKSNDETASGTSDAGDKKDNTKEETSARRESVSNPSADTKDEIQAVCCTEIDSHIWLAVSREDKTLSLYCLNDVNGKDDTARLRPMTVYNMPKRARCLVFSVIPSSSTSGSCNIIITGDLSGDSYAYPVPACNRSTDNEAATAGKPPTRRLLLGHTASMLTGMKVAPSSSNEEKRFILTSDRDEKVRVSYFPETHIIHGYLLGHSAFISAMDAVSSCGGDTRTLCLTASGDGTVRLWDYHACKEVGMVPVVLRKLDGDTGNESEEKEAINDNTKCSKEAKDDVSVECDDSEYSDDAAEDDYDGLIAVPHAVAINSDASYVVVARDGISSIDIHPIPTADPAKKSSSLSSLFLSQLISLHKKQTLACPSQPLGISLLSDGSMLVLAREPEYLMHFKPTGSDLGFEDASAKSPFCSALAAVATLQKISMPVTTLEYNEDGILKLQKKVDNKEFDNNGHEGQADDCSNNAGGKGGLHWNDKERRNTHRLANGRRRKRKLSNKDGK
jgi:tRNA (guanine-N(7)-)-methyltransferase subunit TRM82